MSRVTANGFSCSSQAEDPSFPAVYLPERIQHQLGLACSRCGGRLRLIAVLDASDVAQRILRHLGLPTEVPAARPARAPPLYDDAA